TAQRRRPLVGAGRSAADLARVALQVLIPDPWRARLTPVDEAWGDLVVDGGDAGPQRFRWVDHPTLFRNFVRSIDAAPGPVLHFLQTSLPHRPWHYLPSGRAFFPYFNHGRGAWFEMSDDEWFRIDEQHRHLLQVAFVDRLLGELLDHLETIGLYDRALVIVCADHGASFWPGDNARIVGRSRHPFDILSIPLLIKRPWQREPRLDDSNVETIDILPSIADVLDVDLSGDAAAGWDLDGCSVFDPACAVRPAKRAYVPVTEGAPRSRRLDFDPQPIFPSESLDRKLRLFDSGSVDLGTRRFGEDAALVGRPVAALVAASGGSPGSLRLDGSQRPRRMSPHAVVVPVRVSGVLELDPPRQSEAALPRVAVAARRIVRAVVPAPRDAQGDARVLATLDEATVAGDGDPDLTFYLVEGAPDRARLRPLALR
ncbi:MAG: sulfatase-like hydrolase/transferase, partial [Myxococcales bacterium]|nr:sulfatase-like hydrolase/transferase [Myxococcales bacterium]